MMSMQMTKEEFEGQLKRFGCNGISSACHILLLKTGAAINPKSVRTHLERYGHLSPSLTAAFRMMFREMERQHEYA